MFTPMLRAFAVALTIAATTVCQGPVVVEHLPSGTARLATASSPGGPLTTLPGFASVTFLDIRWTTEIECKSPRTDIPRRTEVNGIPRVELPNGTRIYRILVGGETHLLRVDDAGAAVIATWAGDGLTSGFGPDLAASPSGAILAAATIATPSEYSRIHVCTPTTVGFSDVSPIDGIAGLKATSMVVADDAVFFTAQTDLWRHDALTGATQIVPLPMPVTWIDDEMAISGDGSTIALRAGKSVTKNRMYTVSADGTHVIPYGTESRNLAVNYSDPQRRPGYSLSYDGTLLPHVHRTGNAVRVYVAENFAIHRDNYLGMMTAASVIGVESEIALGDDPLGIGSSGLLLFLPIPQYGNMLAALPYNYLQFLLATGILGNNLFVGLQQLTGLSPYPAGQAPTLTVQGHFTADTVSDRFFLMGPQGAPRDLVRVAAGAPFGETTCQGITLVHESAQVGSMIVLRADTTSIPGQSTGLFVVDTSNGVFFNSSAFPGGNVTRLAASPDHTLLAWTRTTSSPGHEDVWLYDDETSTASVYPGAGGECGLQWTDAGELMFAAQGALMRVTPGAPPVVLGTSALPITIL